MQTADRTNTYVIVPGAWDTPAIMEPLLAPLRAAGHSVIVVDLPCEDAVFCREPCGFLRQEQEDLVPG